MLIGRIAQYAVALLGIVFFIMIYADNEAGITGGLWVTIVAIAISAGLVLIFGLLGLNKKSLMGLGAFAVVFGIAYALADGTVQPEWDVTESTARWIGAGITMFMIAFFGAIGAIAVGEVMRLFK
jgi:hypothetical protein